MKKLIILLLGLLLTGCSATYQLSTLNHDPIYDTVLEVPADVQIDTLSFRQLRWKLRTDFQFRYDFAQYALSQPRSFDWNNRILGNRYNFYNPYWSYSYSWNRDMMWNDWVWGYPYSNWGWNSWSSWNRPYWGWNNYYGWNGYNNWYNGPWHNPGYNVAWNSSRQNNNVAYINGRRGSNNVINRNNTNSNIENRIVVNRNKPRINVDDNNIDLIVNNLRENINKPIRVYNNPNNVIINNNNNNNNNNSKPRVYVRPNNNSNNNNSPRIYTRPPVNNSSTTIRSSSSSTRSSSVSRGGNSNKRN